MVTPFSTDSAGSRTPDGLIGALSAWRELLGAERARAHGDLVAREKQTTYNVDSRVWGVIEPRSTEEVQACLRVANEHRVPVYPVSGGRNWGLGSALPVSDAVVMSLRNMNRIRDFDEQMWTMTVEPGVTFQEAHDRIQESGAPLALNVTGGPPDGSLIANALERGHGFGIYADRFQFCSALEVVLPTGDVVRTGLSRYPTARAGRLHRWGSGPFLDGLFSQSNLGVVTEMTVWLAPRTEELTMFNFHIADIARADPLLEALRGLKTDHRCDIQIQNRFKRAGSIRRDSRNQADTSGLGARALWGFVAVHARNDMEAIGMQWTVHHALRKAADSVQFLPPPVRNLARRLRRPLDAVGVRLGRALQMHRSVWAGFPTWEGVRTMYTAMDVERWPSQGDDMDMDRDGCGLMWCCPSIPFTAEAARRIYDIADEVVLAQGLEPQIALNPLNPYSIDVTIAVAYDRDEDGADERVAGCMHQLHERVVAEGYHPYRLPIQEMEIAGRGAGEHAALMQRLKRTLDPNDILAPGRYDDRAHWPD